MGAKRVKIVTENNILKKHCSKCKELLPLSSFCLSNTSKLGYGSQCKKCVNNNVDAKIKNKKKCSIYYDLVGREKTRDNKRSNIKKYLFLAAKARAKSRNEEFNITMEDFEFVEICPLLNIKMEYHTNIKQNNSFSLDRIDSSKGYIPGNVWIISLKANRIKNDATIEEFGKIYENWKIKLNI